MLYFFASRALRALFLASSRLRRGPASPAVTMVQCAVASVIHSGFDCFSGAVRLLSKVFVFFKEVIIKYELIRYCDGAKWHGGTLTRISQFVGQPATALAASSSHLIVVADEIEVDVR